MYCASKTEIDVSKTQFADNEIIIVKNNKVAARDVTETILESISDGVFTVDHEWRITSFNRAAEKTTGVPRAEAIGQYCWDVFRADMCEGDCALRKTMEEGLTISNVSTHIVNRDGKRVPITLSTALLYNEMGKVLGGVETFRDNSVVEELRRELNGSYRQGDMVSRSPLMKKIFTVLPKIARSGSTVLIEGDTGTGKEVLAKVIHDLSPRRYKPFVAINCGALPDTLLESELFGYKAGAFTDAVGDKKGYFALAEGGTILLDELGETSSAFQVKLLRVLEEKEFQPLGAVRKQKVNVRVLAATNRNLEALIEQGRFRQDLFYRINIVRLCLPPLRERKEDIPLLIEYFIDKLNRLQEKSVSGVDPEALGWLVSYDYPGNIRQLENIVEHAFILCSQGEIGVQHLPGYLAVNAPATLSRKSSIHEVRQVSEEEAIIAALQRNGFSRLAAAKDLGMHKTTLFRKIKKYGIKLPDKDGRNTQHSQIKADSL